MRWDPAQYLRFADHRLRPAVELLARVHLEEPRTVYDVGAGAGNVTRLLRQRWPAARITGVDDSEEMLAKARRDASEIAWEHGDLATWRPPGRPDVIFSNAALHWVRDHPRVMTELFGALASGGVLAVQMPRNFAAPSHTAIAEAVRGGPWRTRLEPLLRPAPVREPAFYYALLAPIASTLDIWETEYVHVLDGPDPVKEWTKGTALRPFLGALDEPEHSTFETRYTELVKRAYPPQPDGRTLFPFRRLFIVAMAGKRSSRPRVVLG